MSSGRRGWVGVDRHWTEDGRLTDAAMRLMMWLDSHTDDFLSKVHKKTAYTTLGWSRKKLDDALACLEALGLADVELVKGGPSGNFCRISIHQSAWSDRDEPCLESRHSHVQKVDTAMSKKETPTSSTSKEKSTEKEMVLEKFDAVWESWPNKDRRKDKPRCKTLFIKQWGENPDALLEGTRAWVKRWRRMDDVRYVPNVKKFLDERWWEMDMEQAAGQMKDDFGSSRQHVPDDLAAWIEEGAV